MKFETIKMHKLAPTVTLLTYIREVTCSNLGWDTDYIDRYFVKFLFPLSEKRVSTYGCTVLVDLGRFFSFLILYTVGRTPSTGDQPVARPLPTHRTTQTQNKRTHTHTHTHTHTRTSGGIRTHDPSVRAGEDSSCLRMLGHCDRPNISILPEFRPQLLLYTASITVYLL
jgi:hypothetical protein